MTEEGKDSDRSKKNRRGPGSSAPKLLTFFFSQKSRYNKSAGRGGCRHQNPSPTPAPSRQICRRLESRSGTPRLKGGPEGSLADSQARISLFIRGWQGVKSHWVSGPKTRARRWAWSESCRVSPLVDRVCYTEPHS